MTSRTPPPHSPTANPPEGDPEGEPTRWGEGESGGRWLLPAKAAAAAPQLLGRRRRMEPGGGGRRGGDSGVPLPPPPLLSSPHPAEPLAPLEPKTPLGRGPGRAGEARRRRVEALGPGGLARVGGLRPPLGLRPAGGPAAASPPPPPYGAAADQLSPPPPPQGLAHGDWRELFPRVPSRPAASAPSPQVPVRGLPRAPKPAAARAPSPLARTRPPSPAEAGSGASFLGGKLWVFPAPSWRVAGTRGPVGEALLPSARSRARGFSSRPPQLQGGQAGRVRGPDLRPQRWAVPWGGRAPLSLEPGENRPHPSAPQRSVQSLTPFLTPRRPIVQSRTPLSEEPSSLGFL
ncbi:basic salivary proline-rich protein 2-like [Mesoplodon densirostris]|uniref:basic salivary proline-rich protein 2-like n=1 Tax=Mesoplodon densirostris TaxID=48708 RepID=UPI0028DC65C5|nr:basic salivary proline-rich protein 2-like [Mesoplodon densirostris]